MCAFLGNWATLVATYGMTKEEAMAIEENYKKGFYGATAYQEKCKKFIENNGYVVICKETGHKAYWWDWKDWYKRQHSEEFWNEYRRLKDLGLKTKDMPSIYQEHFSARNKWDKNGVNSTTQGLGAVIFKLFNVKFFWWLIDNNLFNKVKFCVPVHDEIDIECPKEYTQEVTAKLIEIMQQTGELFCHELPMPAEAEIGDCWRH